MNEKEFNLAILKELRKIAGKVFAKVTVSKEGTYTAAELWDEKDAFGESIVIDYKGTESDIYTAEIGTFKMQVTPQKLWYVLWKFERLCNVKQADKMRFTYGNAENEIISAKAMYYTGSMERGSYNHETECYEVTGNGNYKVVTRKKSLKKLSDNAAEDKKGMLYYKAVDVWYQINDRPLPEKITDRIKNEPDYLFGLLSKFDFSAKCELNPILNALFDAMKSERINNTTEQRKPENEPENSVICDVAKLDTSSSDFNKHEALKETEKRMREKHPNYIALIRYNGMYYSYEKSAKEVRLSDGVRNYITDPGDYICFPESLLDEVLTKLIKAGSGVLTCEIIEDVPEDYPPEPYNEADADETEQNIEKCEPSRDNQEKKCIVEHVSDIQGKNMRPNYLRQKVFPDELLLKIRKIIRFKPRYFVGYTNYHICKENALELERNGNTSVYRALIRGETKNPNYFGGTYIFPDGNEYTITFHRGVLSVFPGYVDAYAAISLRLPLISKKVNLQQWADRIYKDENIIIEFEEKEE